MDFEPLQRLDAENVSRFIHDNKAVTAGLFFVVFAGCLTTIASRFLGRARITYHHATDDIRLDLKDGSTKALSAFCRTAIPRCYLNPFLFNGHLQTLWTIMPHEGPSLDYKRKTFESKDSVYIGSFAVDFVVKVASERDETLPVGITHFSKEESENLGSDDTRPMLVALHGLSGGSYETYLRQVLAPITKNHGWEACVVNSRGCAMSPVTSGMLYNARATWDMRQTVKWLRQRFPNRPLFGIGFSIGANILTNYVGEEGSNCELKAAIVCSNPWNLDVCATALKRTKMGREVYSRAMCQSMKSLVIKHQEELCKGADIDLEEVDKIRYLHEFDRVVQCPTWGYPTEGSYYRDASSIDSLLAVSIPLIAIHAEDDPICPNEAVPHFTFTKNPYTLLVSTSSGGHLSWYQRGDQQWFATAAVRVLNKIMREVQLDHIKIEEAPYLKNGVYNPMRRGLVYDAPPINDGL